MNETPITLGMIFGILEIVGMWLLFRKAGKPGWHSLIPILNIFQEYAICWKGGMVFLLGLLAAVVAWCALANDQILMIIGAVALLLVLVIHWKQSMKLAKSFGRGGLWGLFLFLTGSLGRVLLGLSKAEYVGKP